MANDIMKGSSTSIRRCTSISASFQKYFTYIQKPVISSAKENSVYVSLVTQLYLCNTVQLFLSTKSIAAFFCRNSRTKSRYPRLLAMWRGVCECLSGVLMDEGSFSINFSTSDFLFSFTALCNSSPSCDSSLLRPSCVDLM